MPVLGNSCLVWGMWCSVACFIYWFVDDLMTLYAFLRLLNTEWAEVMKVGLHELVNWPGGEINGSGRFQIRLLTEMLWAERRGGGGWGIDWGCWQQEWGTIFILKREEVRVVWRKLHDLHFSKKLIQNEKCETYCTCMEEEKCMYNFSRKNQKGRDHLGVVVGKMILIRMWENWIRLVQRWQTV
jgi:hypothetical protein